MAEKCIGVPVCKKYLLAINQEVIRRIITFSYMNFTIDYDTKWLKLLARNYKTFEYKVHHFHNRIEKCHFKVQVGSRMSYPHQGKAKKIQYAVDTK